MRAAGLVLTFALFNAPACTKKDTAKADPTLGPGLSPSGATMAFTAPATSASTTTSSTDVQPRFVGRWVHDELGVGMRCGWSGSYVTARFKGSSISARIKDEGSNLFNVVIDGEVKKVLRTDKTRGEAVYPLAEGLADGVHEVAVHRRTESKVGEAVFFGFDALGGTVLPPAPAPQRRIETIGDSISTGYGNEGPNATCTYVNTEQNEYLTYGAITARNLGADHTTIAWSGKTIHEMKTYFDKSLPQRDVASPRWDPSRYQPQVVVLNVGTNNFALVDPGEARFVRVYLDLVQTVRAAYPKAFLVCALGPMLTDIYPEGHHNLTQARKYMKVAVAKLKESGDTNLDLLEFPEQNHADGLGCGFHPSLKTHKLMSDRLTAFIKEHVGW